MRRGHRLEPTGDAAILTLAKSSLDAELRHGIAIVSHDASRTGAPLIALNIARELVEARGVPVVTILLAPGELEPEFARLGPLFVVPPGRSREYHRDPRPWLRLAKRAVYIKDTITHDRIWRRISKYLARRQIRYGVYNTVLSGSAAVRLKELDLASIGLVHELPHLIRINNWTEEATALIEGTEALVFPCPQVQAAFVDAFAIGDKPRFIYPQSGNIHPDQLPQEQRSTIRSAFRARLGLTGDDILVLSSGTNGDFRKGVDLFVYAARETVLSSMASPGRKIVFAWAGEVGSSYGKWADKDIGQLGLSDRLIFLGPQPNMAPCFASADIFFLPSREDPFPTTVLEAMAYGLPVVGFAGTGGIEEQISGGAGIIVPYGDVTSAVKTLNWLAEQPEERSRMARLGQEKVALSGGYHAYLGNLTEVLLGLRQVKRSVKPSVKGAGRK